MLIEYRYIDLIWLDNLIMNFFLLWTTSKLFKESTPKWRLWVASCVGAIYAIFLICSNFHILYRWEIKIILSICIMLVAFKFTTIGKFLKLIGIFYGVTFAFGGGALGLYYFTRDIIPIKEGIFYIENFPVKLLFLSSLLLIIFICTMWPKIHKKWIATSLSYIINIQYNGVDFTLDALLDPGNSLYDPTTKSPVIIVEYKKIQAALPKEVRDIFMDSMDLDMDHMIEILACSNFSERFRLIPYCAIGKPGGLLLGFRPDKISICFRDNWIENRNIIIAIYNGRLSPDEQYHALIHPDLLTTSEGLSA